MTITELTQQDVESAYPALKELRPDLTSAADLAERFRVQSAQGYRLVASIVDGTAVAVAGFRAGNSLSRGAYLYIDDLSTLPQARRQGHAKALLRWIDEEAARLGVDQVHLDSGPQRHDAHRRYLTFGFDIAALHFSKKVG
ncbi:GNAT family N-acetyltransferase [Saccharopolyspora taberi]|uniref:GNAT family N-acetyltransferase n=1 Tax=Saccharopolyspora taberi TaxID=60895 RepID=A0ABN3V5G8_9PSEU